MNLEGDSAAKATAGENLSFFVHGTQRDVQRRALAARPLQLKLDVVSLPMLVTLEYPHRDGFAGALEAARVIERYCLGLGH